jgi:hypothetical protein
MPAKNDPSLVPTALVKALSVEQRLNALVGQVGPQTPTIVYGSTYTVLTQYANGDYTWTCPPGVTAIKVECWGAGAGAGGGSASLGGEGGGGGEYAMEPALAVTPGNVYNYTVGNGGNGGVTGQPGTGGGDTFFNGDSNQVLGNGGSAGGGFIGGAGGSGSFNTVAFPGGNGGGTGSQGTGGCGGGGGAGPDGQGWGGGTSAPGGSFGGAGDNNVSPGILGGSGGGGGNAGVNGSNGTNTGAGGGGCGTGANATNKTVSYAATGSRSYYGSDASGYGGTNNAVRTTNSTIYQGGETSGGGGINGTQKAIVTFNQGQIASDFSGFTITSCKLWLTNQHSWYNSGMSVDIGGWQVGGGAPSSWNGASNVTHITTQGSAEGARTAFGLGAFGRNFAGQAGPTLYGITLGPGPAFSLNYYGYFYGSNGGGNAPVLTISGQSGTGSNTAGAGHDGGIRITYLSGNTMVAAVQPAAVTDSAGNQAAAGYTGAVQAIQPTSNPAVPEGWRNLALPSGWGARALSTGWRCKRAAENNIMLLHVSLTGPATPPANGTVIATLPVGYRPTFDQNLALIDNAAGTRPQLYVRGSTGNVEAWNMQANQQISGIATIALD